MSRFNAVLLSFFFLLSPAVVSAANSNGHWQYVRTETFIAQKAPTAYDDTGAQGGDGSFTVVEEATYEGKPNAFLGGLFSWPGLPLTLVPGTKIDWPISVKITRDVPGGYSLGQHITGYFFPYQTAKNLATFIPYSSVKAGEIDTDHSMPAGRVVTFNNAQLPQPAVIPNQNIADANGMMTFLVTISSHQTYYWSYVYQWVTGPATTSTGGTTSTGATGPASKIADNFNPGACGFTDTAVLNLQGNAHLDRIAVWYNWAQGENSLNYTIFAQGQAVQSGAMTRSSCDPYQSSWCLAMAQLNRDFAAGSYTIRVSQARVCQNSGSGGRGFVQAFGSYAR